MIGIFDSGYGGLTVLKPLLKILPEYDYMYLGDNARAPYGIRSRDTVKKYSEEAVEFLFAQGASLIITACNTVSSLALRHLQQKYLRDTGDKSKKILGVIKPVAEKAVEITKTYRIGVVGTRGTIESKAYDAELKHLNESVKVFSRACPLLVPLIEERWHHKPEARKILKTYLKPLKSANIDVLILGCTHYPLMHNDFQKYAGRRIKVLDTGKITALSLKDYLGRHPEIEEMLQKNHTRQYMTTDSPEKFMEFANRELHLNIKEVKKVQIWK
ncbi:glutamate racemase [Candidatus Peregrinibacteria bacterium]|nr:glutamate racemase [Candidatus Peregrinibacteria bacterium]